MRLDKWLWVARFFKTRALAAEAVDKGRFQINGQAAKRSRDVRVGDTLRFETGHGAPAQTLTVRGLAAMRGAASLAHTLYQETPDSVAAREAHGVQRRLAAEPAHSIEQGRPTKKNRRDLARWDRWSASLDNGP